MRPFHPAFLLAAAAIALLPLTLSFPGRTSRDASGQTSLSVTPENGHSFVVSRAGDAPVRVTFLTPHTFRVHVVMDDGEPQRLSDYMRVKADSAYPPVEVKVQVKTNDVSFSTAAATVRLALDNRTVLLDVTTPDRRLIEGWTINPAERSMQVGLGPTEHIYGFGDKRAAIDQRGQRVEMLNRDAYASETNDSYKSIPFYMSTAGYGLFFQNFHPSLFDIGARTPRLSLRATSGAMDFYVFIGSLKEILAQYTDLTGRPAMLPRWAFGYHQGKASYDDDDAFTVAREMRRRKLPVDVIYYDDWVEEATTKRFVSSLWNRHRVRLTMGFGMPMFGSFGGIDESELLEDLAARGFVMVDKQQQPVIAADQHVDNSGRNSAVAYLDYFSQRAVDHIFAMKWEEAIENGMLLGMVDFGEMDKIADTENKFWPSLGMSVAKTRNLYGLVYPMAVVGGFVKRTGGRSSGMVRPGFAGTQRLGWSTTGDSTANYSNFRAHTRGMLNLSLSGFSNIGQDIGGWDSKGPDILYARWFAAGTFHPFMWSHGQGAHEPYAHGEAVEKAAREFLNLRYRLLPYFYSLHAAAHRTGIPMLRALPLQEQADPAALRIDDQYFIGDNLLVAPLFNDAGDRTIYLPNGLWYDFFGELPPERGGRSIERKAVPLDRLPVYVRAGAIIPLGPEMQHSSEKPVDPLSVHVYGFDQGESTAEERTSEASLYEDDGLTNKYQQGAFQHTNFRYRQSHDALTLEVNVVRGSGDFRAPARAYNLHFRGFSGSVGRVRLDGKDIARVETPARRGTASWTADAKTGEISIVVPRSARRNFKVELVTQRP